MPLIPYPCSGPGRFYPIRSCNPRDRTYIQEPKFLNGIEKQICRRKKGYLRSVSGCFFSVLPLPAGHSIHPFLYPAVNYSKKASLLIFVLQLILSIPLMPILPHYFGIKSICLLSTLIELTVGIVTPYLLNNGKLLLKKYKVPNSLLSDFDWLDF